FKIDTFLLSCRVLGKGVEHTVLSRIGQRALSSGKKFVELTCLTTERNLPAREFVRSLGDQYRTKAAESWLFTAEYLVGLQYNPDEKTRPGSDKPKTTHGEKTPVPPEFGFDMPARSGPLQRIGHELYDINRVAKAIDEFRFRTRDIDEVAETAPAGKLDSAILKIWRKVLGRPGIGMNVNFFEAGGTSLKAVQVIATIRRELKQDLSVTNLFEYPTVSLLASRLSAIARNPSTEPITTGAALRGQQRRSRAMMRTQ
ncbi:MAG: phosphopantetheine-binding protein, partial [Terriglobales bacterium]